MAILAVAAIGGAIGTAGLSTGAAALAAVAVSAAAIGATYLDQRFVYPALFGKESPQNAGVLGIDQMTGDDGSPGYRAWGRAALVGGHVIFFENVETETQRTSSKKTGAGAVFSLRTATVGLGWCHNLIQGVETIYADQKVFWRRSPNNVIWSDYRCTVATAISGTRLAITPSVADAQDIGPVIFVVGDAVEIVGMPVGTNGFWRVVASYGLGDSTYPYGRLELTPLEAQTPAAGDPGSPAAPMEVRRIDGAIFEQFPVISGGGYPNAVWNGKLIISYWEEGPTTYQQSHFWRSPRTIFTPGVSQIVRVSGATPSYVNGRYSVFATGTLSQVGGDVGFITLDPLDGQSGSNTLCGSAGTTNPMRILLDSEEGFLDASPNQELQTYLGTEDQGADPDIEAIFGSGNAHGYRGIARSTIRKYNVSNFGDRVGQHTAVVKVSSRHTTHDVFRDVFLEHYDDDSAFDLSALEANVLLGYSRRGLQQGTTTLQPVAIAYGIESQDIGGKWRLFKAEDADLHQLEESELGAHRAGDKPPRPFNHQRIQDRDLPRRLSLFYRDPLNDYARTEKLTRTSLPSDQAGEDVVVDVDPLVLYPWDAQNAVNRLFVQALIGRDQGTITLGPSRCDVLPNDRITFTALNWNEENLTIDAGSIGHTTQIAGIEPFSVSMEVDFQDAGACRLVDDGDGVIVGYPASVTPTTATVDYDTGEIVFGSDDDILEGRIRYEFPNPWRMRVQGQTCYRNRIFEQNLVAVAERFAIVGSPVQTNDPAYQLVVRPAVIRSYVLDIAGILDPVVQSPGVFLAAAPLPGSTWRGAGVYTSRDGISYTLLDYIETATTMGIASDHLATADVGVVDWSQSLTVTLDHGTLNDATLDQISSGSGTNWALYGDEILAFHRAVLNEDGTYTVSGFVRGLRDTADAIGAHADGERFVVLETMGIANLNGTFHEFPLGPTELGREVYVKIVPTGGALADYTAEQVVWRGENVRPFAPTGLVQGSLSSYGYDVTVHQLTNPAPDEWLAGDVVIRWFRRSRAVSAIFGAGASAPLLEASERYEVRVIRNGDELTARRTVVGGLNTGSPFVHRTFRYTLAEQTADGFIAGDEAVFEVRQIGMGGTGGYSRAARITWTLP